MLLWQLSHLNQNNSIFAEESLTAKGFSNSMVLILTHPKYFGLASLCIPCVYEFVKEKRSKQN